jgi:RND family efflux transporter MFP subunit
VADVVVAGLKLGQTLPIQAEALPGARLEGRITRISPSADPNSRVFEVEAALPNPQGRLKVGMLATLQLGSEVRNTQILVPLAAIVRPAGDTAGYAVYVVAKSPGATAKLRRVRLGQISGTLIAVREGLSAGERVIVRGATIVIDGQAVQILH